jgi:hypothetical protein
LRRGVVGVPAFGAVGASDGIEDALKDACVRADCSDLFSHIKIDLPTAQLAAASAVLVELQLI